MTMISEKEIRQKPSNVYHVAKNGNDSNTGTDDAPFLTIQAAIDHAIEMDDSISDATNQVWVMVFPGSYEEQIHSIVGIHIIGVHAPDNRYSKGVRLINAGTSEATYPLRAEFNDRYRIYGISIETTDGLGVIGKLLRAGIFGNCFFNGQWIENNIDVDNFLLFDDCDLRDANGKIFNLTGTNLLGSRNIAFKHSTTLRSTPTFNSTHVGNSIVRFEDKSSLTASSLRLAGDWNLRAINSNIANGRAGIEGRSQIGGSGDINIVDCLMNSGLHFTADPNSLMIVSSCFRDGHETIPSDEADITADVDITNVVYENNIQFNGLCGKIQIINTNRVVAKSGGDYATIKDALASISGNDTDNRFTIDVAPGVYEEDNPIQMKEYVNISSIGGSEVTKITAKNSSLDVFTGAKDSFIEDIEIANAYTATGILCSFSGNASYKNIVYTNCQRGLKINNSGAEITISDPFFNTTGVYSFDDGFLLEAGHLDIRDLGLSIDVVVGNVVRTTGINSKLHILNMVSESANVTTALNMDDGTNVYCLGTIVKKCTNCIHIGNTGSNTSFTGRSIQLEGTTYDLYNLSPTAIINMMAVDMEREKVFSVCDFIASGWDPTSEKLRRTGDMAIGMDGAGSSLQVGEGGSYRFGVRTLTYDASGVGVFVEIAHGDDIAFSDNGVDSCIYFGDDKLLSFFGLSYLMGSSKLVGGTVVWEYFDATNGWQLCKSLNTITGYSDSYNGESFIGDNDVLQSILFDQDIKTGVKESNVTNTGAVETTINSIEAMWIRCRITSGITSSPIFKTPRLQPNYMHVRSNGTTAYHGESRAIKNVPLPFGDSGSGGASKTLSVSTNISYPYWNNGLNDGVEQELYFRFVLTEDVDTSCGLVLKYIASTSYNGVADKKAKIKVYFSKVKTGDNFDGLNAEVFQDVDFLYTANDDAGLAHFITVTERLDISDMSEDDIVFIMVQRDGVHGDDDLGQSVDFGHVYVEYRQWQIGRNLL